MVNLHLPFGENFFAFTLEILHMPLEVLIGFLSAPSTTESR